MNVIYFLEVALVVRGKGNPSVRRNGSTFRETCGAYPVVSHLGRKVGRMAPDICAPAPLPGLSPGCTSVATVETSCVYPSPGFDDYVGGTAHVYGPRKPSYLLHAVGTLPSKGGCDSPERLQIERLRRQLHAGGKRIRPRRRRIVKG